MSLTSSESHLNFPDNWFYFKDKIITHNSTIISTLGEKNRCLENGVWQDCSEEIDEIVKQKQGDIQTQLENNSYCRT